MTPHTPPSALVDDLRRLTVLELSSSARIGYVALLLAASTMTAVVAALLLTESDLPPRAAIALVVLTFIGLSWVGFAAWVLTRRRVLMGKQSVVAGRMAVAFTGIFALGAALVSYSTAQPAALAAVGMGALMLAVAVVMWLRAKSAFTTLSNRREALARELGETK